MTRNLSNRMMVPILGVAALSSALLLGVTAAWAHGALEAKFDLTKTVNLSGVITSVDWRNPHVHVFMNVKGGPASTAAPTKAAAKGAAEAKGVAQTKAGGTQISNWAVELESPSLLEMDGWSRTTLRPGEVITVKGPRARDGSRQVWGDDVRFATTGLPVFPPKPEISRSPLSARPAPRWPDGHPALGALPGTSDGFWTDPSKTALVEDGVDVKMDKYGLLASIADAAKVAPMQPWALGLYRNRQTRDLRDDPMFENCKPPGGPRMYQSRLGAQFIEDRDKKRIFVLMGSGNHNYRIIYLDGRKQVGLQGGDDDNPLYFGRAVGKWEGDTLVVDSKDFNEDFWFTEGGLPHTDQLHLTERYTRTDMETLRYQVEVDDPGAYTRKWSASWTLKWNGGATLPSHFCQNNRQ
ncbi:MAG: DUF6152 family protein [Acidobacteriota bacterium]